MEPTQETSYVQDQQQTTAPVQQSTIPPQQHSTVVMDRSHNLNASTVATIVNIFIYALETIFIFIEVVVSLRFILMLVAASSSANFVSWIYTTSDLFVKPFAGAFTPLSLGTSTIDLTALLTLAVYGVIHFVVIEFSPRFKRIFK